MDTTSCKPPTRSKNAISSSAKLPPSVASNPPVPDVIDSPSIAQSISPHSSVDSKDWPTSNISYCKSPTYQSRYLCLLYLRYGLSRFRFLQALRSLIFMMICRLKSHLEILFVTRHRNHTFHARLVSNSQRYCFF